MKKKALDSKSPSLKERAVAQYREKDKQVKTSARRDKRQYVETRDFFELLPIIVQEVKDPIKNLKSGIEPGVGNVCAEMLKAEQEMSQRLQHILQDVCNNEVIPDARKRGTIIKLPKKWNLSECNNWRGITGKDF